MQKMTHVPLSILAQITWDEKANSSKLQRPVVMVVQ
jgi:hypothetical protein